MILITAPNSTFGARVLLAASVKNVTLRLSPLPGGGPRSKAFLNMNPVAKIPVLVTESDLVIPESTVIIDYLEDRFPAPSLWPVDLEHRARLRRAIRIMDTYVMDPVIRLFRQLDPARRDPVLFAEEVRRWREGLAMLEHFMPGAPVGEVPLSAADCVLLPSLHLCVRIAAMLELEDEPLAAHSGLIAYYARQACQPDAKTILADLTCAQEETDIKAGRRSLVARHYALAAGRI